MPDLSLPSRTGSAWSSATGPGPRAVCARRGSALSCRSWLTEAAYRMSQMRHADSGCEEAISCATEHGLQLPMQERRNG